MNPADELRAIEQDARRLEEDIALRRTLAAPDIVRIARALVRFFDRLNGIE